MFRNDPKRTGRTECFEPLGLIPLDIIRIHAAVDKPDASTMRPPLSDSGLMGRTGIEPVTLGLKVLQM